MSDCLRCKEYVFRFRALEALNPADFNYLFRNFLVASVFHPGLVR